MIRIFATVAAVFFAACQPATPVVPGPEPGPDPTPVTSPAIIALNAPAYPDATVTIGQDTVSIVLPYGADLSSCKLEFKFTEGASSSPESGSTFDLTSPVKVYLSNPDGAAAKYVFVGEVGKCNRTTFKWIFSPEYLIRGQVSGKNVSFLLPYGVDVHKVRLEVTSDYPLTTSPDITAGIDLSKPAEVTVIAEDGVTTDKLTFSLEMLPKQTGVRGVYLPSPSHTSSFLSYGSVCKSLDLMKELNFNCLFIGSWSATKTAWPSQTLLDNTTYTSLKETNMYASYSGGSGDAVADIIDEAHKRGIKVILWFEYGFMHKVGGVDLKDPLAARHPEWLSKGSDGGYGNYNGTDFYFNGFDPEVQQFIIDLMVEAVHRYPALDGVQGDDRLPAMPRNSGYNENTKQAYRSATGKEVPSDCENADWVAWRRDNLNSFARDVYKAVKAERPGCLVCYAPNKYPWAFDKLFQDWPQWVRDGVVDLLTVQCYVIPSYERDVNSQIKLLKECGRDASLLNPAMILKNGSNLLSKQMISDQLFHNLKNGTCGESQFWFDGLWEKDQQQMFRTFYNYPVEFPSLGKQE